MPSSTNSSTPSESWEEPSLNDVIDRFRTQDAANFFSRFPDARWEFFSDEKNRGEAAVLVPLLYDQDHWRIMMTVRAEHLRSQPGLVALPGGKIDDVDSDLQSTALRETHEEIGLPPEQVQVISQLPPVIAPTRHLVTPYVGVIPSTFVPTHNASEVAETFTTPARSFLRNEYHSSKWIEWRNRPFLLHSFNVVSRRAKANMVMGMSANLAIVTAAVLYSRKPSFENIISFDLPDVSKAIYDHYFNKDQPIPNVY